MPAGETAVPLPRTRDPAGLTAIAAPQWAVIDLQLGYQTAKGKLLPCSDQRLRKGDFVDVTAGIDIVNWKQDSENHYQVYLNLRRVIQLQPRTTASLRAGPRPVASTSKVTADAGPEFDVEEDMDQD